MISMHAEKQVVVGGEGPVFGGDDGFHFIDDAAQLLQAGKNMISIVKALLIKIFDILRLLKVFFEMEAAAVQPVGQIGQLAQKAFFRLAGKAGKRLSFFEQGVGNLLLLPESRGEDVAFDHIDQSACLDLQRFAVVFDHDLIAGTHFLCGEDFMARKQLNVLGADKIGQHIHGGGKIQKPSPLRLFHPFAGIIVAVENDALVFFDGVLDQLLQRFVEILGIFQEIGELRERIGDDGIENNVGIRDGGGGAGHPEFKLIIGKGKGGGAVAVGGVPGEAGQRMNAAFHDHGVLRRINRSLFDGKENGVEIVP